MRKTQDAAGNLRAVLARRNMTRRELADMLDENEMWVSRRLSGKTPISVDDLDRFAHALSVPMTDLLAAS
jgi:transcriptional regulator with XRE-family HTH domain